jgi:hypothetical protein
MVAPVKAWGRGLVKQKRGGTHLLWHQEPTEEEAEQERFFDLLEKAAKLKGTIGPWIQGKSSPDDQGSN